MTGKVFSESANIYQDQARVLFNYYKTAAEKIVAQETENENMRADLESQIKDATQGRTAAEGKKKLYLILAAVLGGLGIILCIFIPVLGIFLLIGAGIFLFLMIKTNKKIGDYAAIVSKCTEIYQKKAEEYKAIRRDYAVEKLGVVYVPIATRVPFNDKSFLIDHTNGVEDMDFRLTLLNHPEQFQESVDSLQKSMESMPVIDSNEMPENINTSEYSLSMQNMTLHDYSGNIDRQVRNISYLLNDNEDVSVDIPVILPGSEEAEFIEEYATTDIGDKHVVPVFNTEFVDKLNQFTELHEARNQFSENNTAESTDYLKQLMKRLAESVQLMSQTKNAGASNMMAYTSSIFGLTLKSGYNFYSPLLEADEIERIRTSEFDYKTSVNDYQPFNLKKSSEVKFDLFTGNWVAEDGSKTAMPFGMHQVDQEVLMPVIAALMEENRIERLRIYADIENQKRDYLERWSAETNNYFRDNRQAADELINRMRETYAEYSNAYNMYNSLQKTVDMMKSTNSIENAEVVEDDSEAELIAGFEQQAQMFNRQQEEFSDYMDRIMDEINETTKGFAHIEYYEGSLRDAFSHETAVAMSSVENLDERKRRLLEISPYMANYAELPPLPKTTDEMTEDASIDLVQQVRESIETIELQQLQREAAAEEAVTETETEEATEKEETAEGAEEATAEAIKEATVEADVAAEATAEEAAESAEDMPEENNDADTGI